MGTLRTNIKNILKERVNSFPQRKRGEIVVFSNELNYDTVGAIAKKLGYEVTGELYDDGYIVKTNPGEEEQAGSDFTDNYPEFFTGYEREDVKDTYLYDEIGEIMSQTDDLRDGVGSLNKFNRSSLPDDWNEQIDDIVSRLEDIKRN